MIAIFGVYIWGYQLDVIFGSLLGCLQIIFFLENHLADECALKLTELWNTGLLFDLNYEFINGSLAFSSG